MDMEFEELCNKIRELDKVLDERLIIIKMNQEILDKDKVDEEEYNRLFDEVVDLVKKNLEDIYLRDDLIKKVLLLQN